MAKLGLGFGTCSCRCNIYIDSHFIHPRVGVRVVVLVDVADKGTYLSVRTQREI